MFAKIKNNLASLILSQDLYRNDHLDFWAIDKTNRMDSSAREKYHLNRLRKILAHAFKKLPFWRNILKNNNIDFKLPGGLNDFKRLPIFTKSDFKAIGEKLLIPDYKRLNFVNVTTSGSAGVPLKILVDSDCLKKRLAVHRYNLIPIGPKYKLDYGHFWLLNTMSGLGIQIDLQRFTDNLDGLYEFIAKNNIKSLGGRVSNLLTMAEDTERRGINLRLRCIQTGSELLSKNTRNYLERVFHCPVYNKYNSAEFGHLGCECGQNQDEFHANTANIYMEILDENGCPAGNNKEGRIIVTSFDNRIMPFIRYAIGDVGKWLDDKCECGINTPRFTFEGRSLNYVSLPDGEKYSVVSIIKLLDNNFPHIIKEMQVVQENIGLVIVKIVPDINYRKHHDVELISSLSDMLHHKIKIKLEIVSRIDHLPGGKAQIFLSKI